MYPLVNPNPHFLIGDICRVIGTVHTIVINDINCNTCQTEDKHQWSYKASVPKGSGLKVAWWQPDELKLMCKVVPYPTMLYQTRRVSMSNTAPMMNNPMLPGIPLPAMLPPGYSIGTVLHGNNPKIGNLWIITVDQSFQASLLFEGKTKTVCVDSLYKRDNMSPNMRIASPHDITSSIGSWANLPKWVQSLMLTPISTKPVLPKPSTTLPPSAVAAVHAALGTTTSGSQMKPLFDAGLLKSKESDDGTRLCPARKGGCCNYQDYYGFTDVYKYCVHCDHKKGMPQ